MQAAEQALEQDSQRFEEYLKENDAKLQVVAASWAVV